jgi:diguanylate cyclase (GGDEF)-like protein
LDATDASALDESLAARRERHALHDLAKRGDRGIFVHLPLWLLLSFGLGLHHEQPVLVWANGAIFAVNVVLRVLLRRRFERLVETHLERARALYYLLLLANCVHWGVLAALSVHWPPLRPTETPLLLVGIGIAASGATTLAISPFVRFWYPTGVLGPVGLAFLLEPTRLHLLLGLMLAVFVLYIYKATEVVYRDYWAAADARWELEARARQLEHLSITDPLTGVHNRLYFEHRLVGAWAHALREGQPLSVLIVDLDHFKRINDSFGHPFGDRCLKAAAQALRASLHRASDVLARYGGEEFAVLLPASDADAAQHVAQRLLESVAAIALEPEGPHDGRRVALTCSIGVSTLVPDAQSNPSAMVNRADKALYAAKEQGRNRVVAALAVS